MWQRDGKLDEKDSFAAKLKEILYIKHIVRSESSESFPSRLLVISGSFSESFPNRFLVVF
jgi:hypothetical protein